MKSLNDILYQKLKISMMKNNLKYMILVAMVLLMGSCGKDFLTVNPVDKLVADNFYSNETQVRQGTASLYGAVWFDFNDQLFWTAGDCMSGNMYHTWDQQGQFFYFSYTEGNAYINSGFNCLYKVISYANSLINDMPKAAGGKVSQDVINRAIGEARFMRGTAFFILAEFWGDVPLVENSTALVSSNNMTLPKNTKSSVYEFVRRDLQFAADNLPASDVPGRVTKWSAKGMLAKLYLTMAQNVSDANSATNFTNAKNLADDVITNSGLSLVKNYADLFNVTNDNNPESLFAFQFMSGNYGIGNSNQAQWARSSTITGNTEAWGGGKSVTYDIKYMIDSTANFKNDARRSAIYMQDGDYYPDINKANGGYHYKIVSYDPNDNTKVLENAAPLLNSLKKYIVGSAADYPGLVSVNQATAINKYVLRLADVYLIYAEAALGAQASTSDAVALSRLNAIRSRASLAPLSSISFMDIFNERRIEFCLEGISWFDVKRYYYRNPSAALSYLNNQKRAYTLNRISPVTATTPAADKAAGYVLTQNSPITVDASKMVLPIPGALVLQQPQLAKDQPAVDYVFQ